MVPDRGDPVCRLADKTGEKVGLFEKQTAKKGVRRMIFLKNGPKSGRFRLSNREHMENRSRERVPRTAAGRAKQI
jgi:hypothetical protein